MPLKLLSALLVVSLYGGTAALTAQGSATATVTAEVQQRTLTITKTKDLVIGPLYQGETKTVAPASSEAAQFTIDGPPNTKVNITFAAPASLSYSSYMLPTGSWRGRSSLSPSVETGTDFTSLGSPLALTLNGDGRAYLFIGTTVSAAPTQAPGTYTGTLTVTVVYY